LKKAQELKKYTHPKLYKVATNFNDLTNNQLLLLNGSAQEKLKEIPDNSIEILFTDPPYYDQVAYSEYLITWNFFLDYKIDYDNEIVVSNREYKQSDRNKYLDNIKYIFELCYQKLKNNAEIFIYFKDSKQKNYIDFINILTDIGFIYTKQFHLNKSRITYKQNSTKKTTSRGDCIIYFTKKIGNHSIDKRNLTKIEFFNHISNLISEYLIEYKKSSTGELLDNIIYKEMIMNNLLEEINEKEIFIFLEKNYIFDNGEWKING
jgi:16S rRNA G966 N2-methylase RsmD